MPEINQPSFSSGEISPSLWGRIDLARYYTSLKTCWNWIVKATGGVINRPGFMYCNSTKNHLKKSRMIEFRFSASQAYALEFGDYYIRIHYRGGLVVYPEGHEQAGEIVEVVTIYPEAGLASLDYTQSADVMTLCHPDYPQQQLSRLAHHLWTIAAYQNVNGPFDDINIVLADTVITNGVSGNITVTAVNSIFKESMVGQMMRIEQSPESLVRQWEVESAIGINDVRKTTTGYYQAVVAGTTGTVRPDHLEGVSYDGNPGVTWRFLHAGFGIVRITGFTSDKILTGTVLSRLPEQVVTAVSARNITSFTPGVAAVGDPPSGASPARVGLASHGFYSGQSITISGMTSPASANGVYQAIVIDANTFDILNYEEAAWSANGTVTATLVAQPTYKWAFELWGGDLGYPATSTYYQQRQIFGGLKGRPNSVQMSKSAGFLDFGQSIPSLDDDAILFSLQSGSIANITHFVGLKQLIALTTEGPWLVQKNQGEMVPVTEPQGEGGASSVKPLKINKQGLYVEDKGGAIRSLGYEFSSDTYEGKDLTITADHLFKNKTVVDWAFQKVPFRCVWMVMSDGSLVGLTYMVEQEVVGWHRHTTDGLVESICSVSEEDEDALYIVVNRTIAGETKRYVERLSSRNFATKEDSFFVDSGLTYDGRTAVTIGATTYDLTTMLWTLSGGVNWDYQDTLDFSTTVDFFTGASDVGDVIVLTDSEGGLIRLKIMQYVGARAVKVMANKDVPLEFRAVQSTGFQMARDTFSGAGHLEGKTVAILADGKVQDRQVITGGSFTLPNAAVVVHFGLPITADIETLDINVQGQSLHDRVKNVNSVSLMVKDTRGLMAGPDENHLYLARTEIGSTYDDLLQEKTGLETINITSDWSKGGRVLIRQDDPLPAEIISIIPNVTVSGS